jgi:hypothetical protein
MQIKRLMAHVPCFIFLRLKFHDLTYKNDIWQAISLQYFRRWNMLTGCSYMHGHFALFARNTVNVITACCFLIVEQLLLLVAKKRPNYGGNKQHWKVPMLRSVLQPLYLPEKVTYLYLVAQPLLPSCPSRMFRVYGVHFWWNHNLKVAFNCSNVHEWINEELSVQTIGREEFFYFSCRKFYWLWHLYFSRQWSLDFCPRKRTSHEDSTPEWD